MNKKISLFILIILTLSLFGSSPKPVHAQDWWNQNWSYRVTIEIDRTKIEAIVLTDFPVLIYLNSTKINWAHVQDDLDDLRFIDGDDITQLYAELENYTVNDEAWIWVKLPNIWMMVGEPNQAFYLYYGNNAVSSWWNPEDVWETSAVMVQHMRDNPDNAHVMDSTQYDNDGAKKGANEPIETASGKIDSAQDFEDIALGKYVEIIDSVSISPINQVTILCWVNGTSLKNTAYVWKHSYNYLIYSEPEGTPRLYIAGGAGGSSIAIASEALELNQWVFIVGTLGIDGKARIYIDGTQSGTTGDAIVGIKDNAGNLFIGKRGDNIGVSFPGIIDEARIYNEVKSAEWIKADYNSGADTLLIYGAEELCPLALTILYNTGINKLYINGTQRANNTTIYIDKNTNVNATVTLKPNFIFMKYALSSVGASLIPTYIFNMTNPFTLWSYATPNFFIYEEPTTFTFTHWLILLFIALVISLLAAIKFHIIAVASFILTVFMIINVASYSGMILLAIIIWILTILFSIIAILEI